MRERNSMRGLRYKMGRRDYGMKPRDRRWRWFKWRGARVMLLLLATLLRLRVRSKCKI